MAAALEPIKKASSELITMYWPDGTLDTCRVRVGVLLADLEEQWDLASLKHHGTRMVDVLYLIPNTDITNFGKELSEFPKRKEALHKKSMKLYWKLKGTSEHRLGEAAIESLSTKPVRDVAIWGINPEIDSYELFGDDRLHQDFNGLTLHLIKVLTDLISETHGAARAERVRGIVNGRLHDLRNYHEAFYPSQGLDAQFVHAEERRGLMKFLPIAIRGIEEIPDHVVDIFADYARYQQIRDNNIQTDANLRMLTEMSLKLSKDIVATFGHLKDFNFAKFLNMRKYADCIRDIGMLSLADTGHREAYIKFIRKCWDRTNKICNGIDLQVAAKSEEFEALEKAINSGISSSRKLDKAPTGARQRALANWQPSMSPGPGKLYYFDRAQSYDSWEAEMLEQVLPLSRLQDTLQAFLNNEEPPEQVEIRRCLGLPRYEGVADIVHSHPAFFNRKASCQKLDDVAYRLVGQSNFAGLTVESEDVAYAQVIAVGVVGGLEFVFCRRYACPLALSEEAFLRSENQRGYVTADYAHMRLDTRGNPLTLRPLVWEPTPRGHSRTLPGAFVALSPSCLLNKVCIVPDYQLGPNNNFLVNDWVHALDDNLQCSDAQTNVEMPPPFSGCMGGRDMNSYGFVSTLSAILKE